MADDLQSAFQTLQQGIQSLQASRVLTQANDAVTQIRNSELSTNDKNNQLRTLGEQMAFGLAGQGISGTQIAQLAGSFVPAKQGPIQSLDQGLLSEDPEVRARAREAARLKAAANQNKSDDAAKIALDKQGDGFAKFIQADNSVRSALGQTALNKQRAENLRALVGPDLSPQALAKLPPQQLGELAIGMSTLVKNGVASESEVKMIFPETAGMDKAKMAAYLSGGPQPANAEGFANLYLKTIQREQGQAQDQLERSVIQRATGHRYVQNDPENARIKIAAQLGIQPEDVLINTNDKGGVSVTTKNLQEKMDKVDSYVKGSLDLQKNLKSTDPTVRANALKQAAAIQQRLGIDVSKMSPTMIKQEFEYRVKSGDL